MLSRRSVSALIGREADNPGGLYPSGYTARWPKGARLSSTKPRGPGVPRRAYPGESIASGRPPSKHSSAKQRRRRTTSKHSSTKQRGRRTPSKHSSTKQRGRQTTSKHSSAKQRGRQTTSKRSSAKQRGRQTTSKRSSAKQRGRQTIGVVFGRLHLEGGSRPLAFAGEGREVGGVGGVSGWLGRATRMVPLPPWQGRRCADSGARRA